MGCERRWKNCSSCWRRSILPAGTGRPCRKPGSHAPFVIGINTNRSLDTAPPLANPSVRRTRTKPRAVLFRMRGNGTSPLSRKLARNTTLQIGYVGNTGVHLTSMCDSNAIPQADWLHRCIHGRQRAERASSCRQLRIDRRLRPRWPCKLPLAAGTVPSANRELLNFPGGLHLVPLDRKRRVGQFIRWLNQEAITDQDNPGLDKGNTNINRPNIFVANEVFYLPETDATQPLGAADPRRLGSQQHLLRWLRAAR